MLTYQIEGICDVPMIQQWKLELMAKMIFDSLFKDKEKTLNLADDLLEYGISEERKTNYGAEILRCQNLLKKQRSKLDVLLELRLNREIEPSEYKEKQDCSVIKQKHRIGKQQHKRQSRISKNCN